MTYESFLQALQDVDVGLPILCSLIAGSMIGMEREWKGKPAGLRTHMLLCFASTLLTLLGLRMGEWGHNLPEGAQIVTDMARMPHAILTGVGFLGAGVIFREGASVQGLTTAATLWLTAALGVVFGTGLIELGLLGTLVTLVVLVLLRVLQRLAPPRPAVRLEVLVAQQAGFTSGRLLALLAQEGLKPGPLSIRQRGEPRDVAYTLVVSKQGGQVDGPRLVALISAEEAVLSVALTQLDAELGADA